MKKIKNSTRTVFGLIVAIGLVAAVVPRVGYGQNRHDFAVGSVRVTVRD